MQKCENVRMLKGKNVKKQSMRVVFSIFAPVEECEPCGSDALII